MAESAAGYETFHAYAGLCEGCAAIYAILILSILKWPGWWSKKGMLAQKRPYPQGLMLTVGYHTFIIAAENASIFAPPRDEPELIQDQALPLNLPGVTPLPHTNWQLKADFLTPEHIHHHHLSQVDRWEAYLDADVVGSAPILRPRRPGDTFMPLGLAGHSQKVNEFMINEKIPAAWRNRIPLFVSADQVLWVCGYRLDERARLRPSHATHSSP